MGPASAAVKAELVFTYGTLKQGFSNHGLLQDMMATGDAAFMGPCRTRLRLPLVCGPYRVPFLLNIPGRGHRISGELYAVSPRALSRMDELEGLARGHYERLPIEIQQQGKGEEVVAAWAYYAHHSYADGLWKRNGEEGYECYSEKVATGYVRRKDRPQHLSFLDQIRLFISSSPVNNFDGGATISGQLNAPASISGTHCAVGNTRDQHCIVPA